MIGCLEVRRLMPRLLALELTPEAESGLRDHLRACQGCREVLAAREPATALAWTLAGEPEPGDDRFAGEVLAGIHQRSLERRLSGRRWRLVTAAAVFTTLLLGGTVVVRHFSTLTPAAVAEAPQARVPVVEPAFVEVDEAGVRLYQLTPASQSREAIQVAFIVDPHLEL
jgi:hypothetical protein